MNKALATALLFLLTSCLHAQSLGNAGTIEGTVVDQSGALIPQATVSLVNSITGYKQNVTASSGGAFRLLNIPPNAYHLTVAAPGFSTFQQDVTVRNSVPVTIKATLLVAEAVTTVDVEASGAAQVETDPSAHTDVDRSSLLKLPNMSPGGGLADAIVYTTGSVSNEANGAFHPAGDHAQVSYLIDGQIISDQQSKIFSTSLPTSAIQSMELITGSPGAEFGDKTSLVAQVTTRSGLGVGKVFGSFESSYGSFGTVTESLGIGFGSAKMGNFLAIDGVRSGRFLDSPEWSAFHDAGNNQTIFDRFDWQPTGKDSVHLNLFAARNWIQIPNDLDQLAQDQRQRVLTWNIAPGYQHTINAHTLLSVNPYVRKDQFNYYASRDVLDDQPATQNQQRQLMNWGVKADLSSTIGHHNIKIGLDLKQTRLLENFGFGITDPTYNSPCLDASNSPVGDPSLTSPSQCAAFGYQQNIASNPNAATPFSPGLLPYDLTRKGQLFAFHATANINQYAGYAQDSMTFGNLTLNLGFRADQYSGLVSKSGPQPRAGLAYHIKRTNTVLRAAYSRTFETPFNENLLLSSATGFGGLAGNVFGSTSVPISPGFRNQFNTGFQQSIGRYFLVDADYFWKFTHNAFDFSTLLNTTITFPVAWHNSKNDGVTGRFSTINMKGFQAYWTFGHTRARYFPPEDGGLIPQGAPLAAGVFRIDHDQAFQSTINLRYQRRNNAEWIAFTARYDSGEVVSGVPDAGYAMANLTPNQQVTIGLACNGTYATVAAPISSCSGTVTSRLLTLPQIGQENDDHNPNRVKPRNIFNLGIGSDNLFHTEKTTRWTASLSIDNLTNKVALYNFMSTFSGTHFIEPRSIVGKIGFVF
ncbi:MAG TPA: TonB-dependent receptor [Bryobacteraceae bacterium]|nr:TonB-dependent receptor [Bryobacteraceae bacterium]